MTADTGLIVRLLHCRRQDNLIGCAFDVGEWWGTVEDFWKQFESVGNMKGK